MNDFINRQDAIDLVEHRMKHNPMKSVKFIQGLQDAYLRVISDLNRLPPADVVERKHGEWIQDKNVVMGEGYVWYCSECSWARFYGFNEPMHNYCPNCGARMVSEDER